MGVTTDEIVVKLLLDESEFVSSLTQTINSISAQNIADPDKIKQQADVFIQYAQKMADKYGVSVEKMLDSFKKLAPIMEMQTGKSSSGPQPSISTASYNAREQRSGELSSQVTSPVGSEKRVQELSVLIQKLSKEFKISNAEAAKLAGTVAKIGEGAGYKDIAPALKLANKEEAKALTFAQQRKKALDEVIKAHETEIRQVMSLTKAGEQRAATEKLIVRLSKESGSNVVQVAGELRSSFGAAEPVVTDALHNIEMKTRGFAGAVKRQFGDIRNYISTAFGTFLAMVMFGATQTVSQFFTDVLQQAKNFGNSLQQLKLAEQILSENGIEVTNRQLLELASNLAKVFKTTSNDEILKLVSDIAIKLEDANLSVEQLGDVAEIVLNLRIANPDKSIDELSDVVTRSLVTDEQKAMSNLGMIMSPERVKQFALEKQLITDINDEMSEQEKIRARLLYLAQLNEQRSAGLLEQQDSLVNAGNRLESSWKNFTKLFAGFVNNWNALLVIVAEVLDVWGSIYSVLSGAVEPATKFQAIIKALFDSAYKGLQLIQAVLMPTLSIFNAWIMALEKITGWKLPRSIEDLYKIMTGKDFKSELTVETLEKIDTKTGTPPPVAPPIDPGKVKNLRDNIHSLIEALDQMGDAARKAFWEFTTANDRASEDYNHKLSLINNETNEKIEEANQQHRNNELIAEMKFQEKMRQMREKFLFSLEDAVRERDARQILKLQEQYGMDKTAAINEREIEKIASELQYQEELEALQAAGREKQEELTYQYELDKKRREEDYRQQEKERTDALSDKLRDVANGLADELGLNEQGAQAIYNALSSMFGPSGAIKDLTDYTYANSISAADAALKRIQEIAAKYKQTAADMKKTQETIKNNYQMAPNGPPPGINQGTGGTPLGDTGMTIPTGLVSTAMSSSPRLSEFQSMANRSMMDLDITLSPELEARIVRKSVTQVGDIVAKVKRK